MRGVYTPVQPREALFHPDQTGSYLLWKGYVYLINWIRKECEEKHSFEIQNYIKPSETIVFLGSSGVGKSSLVNAIAGEEIMKVNHIREDDSKGRHTTTHRQLIMLKNGAMIIDTPGMRELAMWDVSDGLNSAFDDIKALESECKFRNCTHKSEPGCKVKSALESGDLSIKRWENYMKLKKEDKFSKWKESIKNRSKSKKRYKEHR